MLHGGSPSCSRRRATNTGDLRLTSAPHGRVSVAGGLDFVPARAGWRARVATPVPAKLIEKALNRGGTWPTRGLPRAALRTRAEPTALT